MALKSSSLRFSRKFTSLGASLSKGRPLADIGAERGAFAVAFEGFGRIAESLIAQGHEERTKTVMAAAEKEGVSEAEKAILNNQMVQLREEDTLAGQAFNKSVQSAYMTRLDLNFDAKVSEIAARHPDDPEMFGQSFDNTANSLLANLPEQWHEPAKMEISKRRNGLMSKVGANALKREADAANADLISGQNKYAGEAAQALRSGDLGKAEELNLKYLGALDARTDLSAQQKEKGKLDYQKHERRHVSLGEFERALQAGPDAGDRFIKDFTDGESITDPDEREKVAGEMAARLGDVVAAGKTAKAQVDAQIKKQKAEQFANVDIAIGDDKYGLAELKADENAGLFSDNPEKRATFTKAIKTRDKKKVEKQERASLVSEALTGSRVLDPGNAKHRRAVNETYAGWHSSQQVNTLPSVARNALSVDFAKKTGIVPDGVKSQLRSGLIGTPEAQAEAADLYTRLDAEGLDVDKGLNARDVAKAGMIADAVNAGVEPAIAVERADKITDPANRALSDARETAFKDIGAIAANDVTDHFDTWHSFEPDVTPQDSPALEAEANGLFKRHFLLTGDEAKSKEYALKTIGRTWGVTNADGSKRLMKYPPESFYGYGEDSEWIAGHLSEDVGPERAGNAILFADDITAREASTGKPSWQVIVQDENGVFSPVTDDAGSVMRWRPDASLSVAQRQEIKRKARKAAIEAEGEGPERDKASGLSERSEIQNDGFDALRQRTMGDDEIKGGAGDDELGNSPKLDQATKKELIRQMSGGEPGDTEVAMVDKKPGQTLGHRGVIQGPGGGGMGSAGRSPIKLPKTPGGNEAARLKAIQTQTAGKANAEFFKQSPVQAFNSTNFPPRDPDENVNRGLAAVDLVIQDALSGGPGVVKAAMHREGLGPVSLYWGEPGNPSQGKYQKGTGLSHLIAKHGIEAVEGVLDAIVRGTESPSRNRQDRLNVEYNGYRAVLDRFKDGDKETWLLTGFELGDPKLIDTPTNLKNLTGPIFFGGGNVPR